MYNVRLFRIFLHQHHSANLAKCCKDSLKSGLAGSVLGMVLWTDLNRNLNIAFEPFILCNQIRKRSVDIAPSFKPKACKAERYIPKVLGGN